MLKITLTAGMVGTKETQRRVVRALGLGKFGSQVFHADSPTIRGMIRKVNHLVSVTQDEGAKSSSKTEAKNEAAKAEKKNDKK